MCPGDHHERSQNIVEELVLEYEKAEEFTIHKKEAPSIMDTMQDMLNQIGNQEL